MADPICGFTDKRGNFHKTERLANKSDLEYNVNVHTSKLKMFLLGKYDRIPRYGGRSYYSELVHLVNIKGAEMTNISMDEYLLDFVIGHPEEFKQHLEDLVFAEKQLAEFNNIPAKSWWQFWIK